MKTNYLNFLYQKNIMKSTIITTILFFCICSLSHAQNVGIGEIVPASKLAVKGSLSVGSGYSTTAAPTDGVIIQGQVGIAQNTSINSNLKLAVNGSMYAANLVTIIPLYAGYGGPPTVSSSSSTQFSYCQAGLVPTTFRPDGYIQVQLVVYYTTSATTNQFQLDANNSSGQIYPITCSGCGTGTWTYSYVGGPTVAISPWVDWNAGTSAYQIHLEGFTGGSGTISVYNAYLQVRPKNN